MNHNCLTCKHWNRLFENPDIGTCEAVDVPLVEAYRFQFEECSQFAQGEAREPYYHLFREMLVNSALEPNWDRVENYYSIPFGEIAKPKPKPVFVPYAVTDDKLPIVAEWRSEKRSRHWIAQKLGVSEKAVTTAETRAIERGLL